MKLDALIKALGLTVVVGETDKCFDGVYTGDFLSRAMSHVAEGNLWITIMPNSNCIAVASLTETAAIILAEGVELLPDAKEAAIKNDITVLSSPDSAFRLCVEINSFITNHEQI